MKQVIAKKRGEFGERGKHFSIIPFFVLNLTPMVECPGYIACLI